MHSFGLEDRVYLFIFRSWEFVTTESRKVNIHYFIYLLGHKSQI